MSPRYRRISPSEWSYLAAARVFPPFAIQLWIEADTVPDTGPLESALRRAAEANPGARLIPSGRWWNDGRQVPRVNEWQGTGTITASDPLFQRGFSFAQAPIEVWKAGTSLIFRCSHALMDARGLLFFAEETFRALRGETLLGTSCAISDHDYLQRFRHAKRRGFPGANCGSPLDPQRARSAGFVWEQRRLADVPALTAKLQHAIAQLALQRSPDRRLRFMVPVDLRQADPAQRTAGNLSNALLLEYAKLDRWPDAYEQTLRALSEHQERATDPLDGLVPWLPRALLARLQAYVHQRCVSKDRYLFSGVISHVGRVSLARLGSQDFVPRAARFMPFDAPGSALTLVITQHDYGTEIGASAPAAIADKGHLAAALDNICRAVTDAPETPRAIGSVSQEGTPAKTMLALFAEQVARAPERRAASDATSVLSYGELDARSRAWARQLRAAGVGRGDRVVIAAARSPEVIAALLGILRVGAVFVPVDPEWPLARAEFVVRNCAARCIVTDARHSPLAAIAPLLNIGSGDLPDAVDEDAPIQPEDTAYVMYTSGSTGNPKGVMVSHASLSNYLQWARSAYTDAQHPPVFPFFTSLAFDLTLTALLMPLISGGEVRVFSESVPVLAARALLEDGALNSIKLTPSHLRLLCELGLGASSLRTFIVGGEVLPVALASRAFEQCAGAARIFNEYGPTEATVGCVVHRFDPQSDRGQSVPIGRPISNTTIQLLDESGARVAPGAIGEIAIAGHCLATGYLSASAENVRFETRDGIRLYRSGDLGSMDAGGNYLFHGRRDDQVKLLGHRIELVEVEQAIAASALVSSAAAAVSGEQNARLVAFVVWSGQPDLEGLRRGLAEVLPNYMLPALTITVDAIPLSVNGKVDRRKLLEQVPALASSSPPAMPSRGLEDDIREVLAGILGVAPATLSTVKSIHEQGCDSLQMAIFLARVTDRFLPAGAAPPWFANLGEFLRTPTIQRLAETIGGAWPQFRGSACPPSAPF